MTVACGDRRTQKAPDTSNTDSSAQPTPDHSKLPWVGGILQGDDPDALKAYLSSVKEVTPTKFKVEWNPATVAFDRAATLRALRGVSRDGRRFTLDPTEPAVVALAPACKRITYSATGRIGIETVVVPIPIEAVQKTVNDKLSPKYEVFKKERVMLIPNIKGCEIN
jgi:hypothetical protein